MDTIGSKHSVFLISFNYCEITCCHLDGYKNNREALLSRLSLIESFFKPNSRHRVWYNIDDSELSDKVIEQVTQSISRVQSNIVKLAFIGAGRGKRKLKKILNDTIASSIPIGYFEDAELAKEWLR